MRNHNPRQTNNASGFSLLELIIAMTITIVVMGCAARLLATSFNIRNREDTRTDALADTQRAINVMSREIAMGGYGFDAASNGLVSGDSTDTTIRVRSNLNRYTDDGSKYTISGAGEDIKYQIDVQNNTNFLVRYDMGNPTDGRKTVLANKIDSLAIVYLDSANAVLNVTADPSQVANAAIVRITVGVTMPQVGTPGAPGYQKPWPVLLTSDVALRNKKETIENY
jgi:Tfp pilus assembly protein PilW